MGRTYRATIKDDDNPTASASALHHEHDYNFPGVVASAFFSARHFWGLWWDFALP